MDEGRRHGRISRDSILPWVEFQLPGLEGDAGESRVVSDDNDLSVQRAARCLDGRGLSLPTFALARILRHLSSRLCWHESTSEPDDGEARGPGDRATDANFTLILEASASQTMRQGRGSCEPARLRERSRPGDRLAVWARIDAVK